MFLHQVILHGTFGLNGFEPTSFSVQDGEDYIIHRVRYREYWRYGMEKYICDIKNQRASMTLVYDSSREKWFIFTETAISDSDVLIR